MSVMQHKAAVAAIIATSALLLTEFSSAGDLRRFRALDVVDGRTLRVLWLEENIQLGLKRPASTEVSYLRLRGIWSDKNKEPTESYESRVRFLQKYVQGQVITAAVRLTVTIVSRRPPREPITLESEEPEQPSEVILADGSSVNEALLEQGYAVVDITWRYLGKKDRERYEAAEARARATNRGIWSSGETGQVYLGIKERLQREQILKDRGTAFYLIAQLLLTLVVVALIYVTHNDPASFAAALKLLVLPFVLAFAELLRATWPPWGPLSEGQYVFGYWVLVAATFLWVVRQMLILLVSGPLGEWRTLWTKSEAVQAVVGFFLTLWGLIFSFGLLYRIIGVSGSTWEGLHLSMVHMLNLGYQVPIMSGSAFDAIVLFEKLVKWVMLLLFGAMVPRLHAGAVWKRSALVVSVCSFLVFALAISSAFTNLYYFNVDLEGFSRPLDRREAFLFALATFALVSYSNVYATSKSMLLGQIVEIHFGLFMGLVGARFLFASLQRGR